MLDSEGSITHWIHGAKLGDPDATRCLWDAYVDRLMRLARSRIRMSVAPSVVEDEEDAVLDAFDSFCRGAMVGRFPALRDREDLWRLLALITIRKVLDQKSRQKAARRGGRDKARREEPAADLEGLADERPQPEMAALLAEEYRLRIASLDDEQLQQIAVWRMDGYTEDEIADKLGCVRRTVARRLELIRLRWMTERDP